jgi:hypothetical protein
MAGISRVIAQPFEEADSTILDNFTDEELSEIERLSAALKRILTAAKERNQRATDPDYRRA